MKTYDLNNTLKLALVSDDDGSNIRYEPIVAGVVYNLEASERLYLLQRHYVANVVIQGLAVVGKRITIVPEQWVHKAGR